MLAVAIAMSASGCANLKTQTNGASVAAASSVPCTASQLKGSATPPSPGAGQISVTITVRNVSTASCQLRANPHVTMRDPSGSPLPTTGVGSGPTKPVQLKAKSAAVIYIGWPDQYCPGSHPQASALDLTFPGMTQPVTVSLRFTNQPAEAPSFTPCQGRILLSAPSLAGP